jgi:hypothetical protein
MSLHNNRPPPQVSYSKYFIIDSEIRRLKALICVSIFSQEYRNRIDYRLSWKLDKERQDVYIKDIKR